MKLYDCETKDIALGRGASCRLERAIVQSTFVDKLADLYFVQHKKQVDIALILEMNLSAIHSALNTHFTKEKLTEEKEWRKLQTSIKYGKSNTKVESNSNGSLNTSDSENLRILFFNYHLTYKKIGEFRGTSAQNIHKLIHKYFSASEIEKELDYRSSQSQRSIRANKAELMRKNLEEYDNKLIQMYNAGTPIQQIADTTGRTYSGIIDHLNSLRNRGIVLEKRNPSGGNYR